MSILLNGVTEIPLDKANFVK